MPTLNKDEKDRMFAALDLHTKQNDKIERGLYGDKPNNVKGALDQIQELRDQIHEIRRWILKRNLVTAYISGVIAAAVLIIKMTWDVIWTWFSNRPKG